MSRILQAAADQTVKHNYYTNTSLNLHYQFANIETRPIDWTRDPCFNQILIGDELSRLPHPPPEDLPRPLTPITSLK